MVKSMAKRPFVLDGANVNCSAFQISQFPDKCHPEAGPKFSARISLNFNIKSSAFTQIQFHRNSSSFALMVNRNIRPGRETMARKFYSLFSRSSEKSVTSSRNSMDDDDSFEDTNTEFTPLSAVVDAFEELSALLKAKGFDYDLDLKTFCDACSLVSVLFGCLGIAFKFAELEYVSKVRDLAEASESYRTLKNVLDFDVQNDTVRTPGSLSRNLRRVRQGLDLIRALFQNFLSSDDCYLKEAASTAYAKTCAPYHTWAVRTAVYAGMYALPTRDQLLLKLNETESSAERAMIRYINASLPVIEYIDKLYISRDISLDW